MLAGRSSNVKNVGSVMVSSVNPHCDPRIEVNPPDRQTALFTPRPPIRNNPMPFSEPPDPDAAINQWIAERYHGRHELTYWLGIGGHNEPRDPFRLEYGAWANEQKPKIEPLIPIVERAEAAVDALGCDLPQVQIVLNAISPHRSGSRTSFWSKGTRRINLNYNALGPRAMGDLDPELAENAYEVLLHEFGHAYFDLCMSWDERKKWVDSYGTRTPVSDYSEWEYHKRTEAGPAREEFAEVFRRAAAGRTIPEEASWWLPRVEPLFDFNPKTTKGAVYVHRSHVSDLSETDQKRVNDARKHLPNGFRYTVVKVPHTEDGVSFIYSPDWDKATNPEVGASYRVHTDGTTTFTPGRGLKYHKKALFNPRAYTAREQEIANATDRPGGVFGSMKGVVAKHVYKLTRNNKAGRILDFGAGVEARCTKALRKAGRNVTAHDYGDNYVEGVHAADALSKQYDVVFASNVLNVQATKPALEETIRQIAKATKPTGVAVVNFPVSPRKSSVGDQALEKLLRKRFKHVETVGDHLFEARHVSRRDEVSVNPMPELNDDMIEAIKAGVTPVKAAWNDLPGDVMSSFKANPIHWE